MKSVLSKSSLVVLTRTLSTNAHGEEVETYATGSTYKGYVQPRSDNINSMALLEKDVAGLEVIPYSHEAFVFGYSPKPENDRLRYLTETYHVRAVKQWPTHTHCLLEQVVI